jgi:tRNA threonylcarbamoyladenosine biosynthesis protein TsaB
VKRAIVALETSGRAPSVAVRRGALEASRDLERDRAHASDLLPALDALLREVGGSPAEIGAVLVGTGPGSYTGLRVGLATALGIVRGTGAQLRGVPSGETLCYAELRPGEEATVLLDARAGEVYFARYRRTADEIEVVRAPCVLPVTDVRGAVEDRGPIFGDREAIEAAGALDALGPRFRSGVRAHARALLALGTQRLQRVGAQAPSDVAPLYLRPFAVRARRR